MKVRLPRRKEASAGAFRLSLLSVERFGKIARILGILAVLAIPGRIALAQGGPVSGAAGVSLLPSAMPGVVGTPVTLTLRVNLSGVTGKSPAGASVPAVLGAYQVRVSFDKNLLRFDSASGGGATGYTSAPVYTDPGLANTNGAVTLAAAQTSPIAPTGLVPVATLTFQALAPGAAVLQPTPLSLSTALQVGPPDVGLAPIPGTGGALTVPLDVVSGELQPQLIRVDPSTGPNGNGNGILEPGEQATAAPSWKNMTSGAMDVTGAADGFAGPTGATYGAPVAAAGYGAIDAGATSDCLTATGNCYALTVSVPATRPSAHWDAYFTESPSTGDIKTWSVHVGGSFTDVPTSYLFYKGIETIFHNGVTGGCGGGIYCPDQTVTRAQMSVFLLKSRFGSTYVAPLPTGTEFLDVPFAAFGAAWIEDVAARGITTGCGGGNFCPNSSVTRASMAVLLLRTEHGSSYAPPAATGMFSDVPANDPFAKWIEQLSREGVTSGCGGGKYCPNTAVTRGQMAAFLSKTFKLSL